MRDDSEVLTIRIPGLLGRQLRKEARRQRRSRSAVARDLLAASLGSSESSSIAAEARRQSMAVGRRRSEREAIRLVADLADLTGWR